MPELGLAILIRTWSDAAFLGKFDVDVLPIFFAFSAVVFLPTTAIYTWLSKRIAPVVLNTLVNTPADVCRRTNHAVEFTTGGAAPPAAVMARLRPWIRK